MSFRRQKIKLANINHAQTAVEATVKAPDAWSRQLGSDGAKNSKNRLRYKVQLLNVTSFVDVGHLPTLLKTKLAGTDITAYSIGTGGPSPTIRSTGRCSSGQASASPDWKKYTGSCGLTTPSWCTTS